MPSKQGGARALRARAKNLEIPDWELLDRDALAAAVAEAEAEEEEDEAEAGGESPSDPYEAARASIRTDEDDEEEEERAMPTKKPVRRKATGTKKAPTKTRTKKVARKSAPATKKRTSKKAPASKKATKKRAPRQPTEYEGPNPYRPGTNLYHLAEALMKGGKRSVLVKQLKKKLEFNPRTKTKREFDTDVEIDRRLKVVGYILRKDYGFDLQHDGRGPDAFIKATPPR